jgi:ABC-type transport system substrate-binding protein
MGEKWGGIRMLAERFCTIAVMLWRSSRLLLILGITWATLFLLGLASRVAAAQGLNVPPTVEKLTIAVEAWGGDSLNPVHAKTVNFLWANFLPFLVTRDEQNNIVPALASSWEGSPAGWTFTLNPEAKWEDRTPITAEDVKTLPRSDRDFPSTSSRWWHTGTKLG